MIAQIFIVDNMYYNDLYSASEPRPEESQRLGIMEDGA